jgi:hypothetical protein
MLEVGVSGLSDVDIHDLVGAEGAWVIHPAKDLSETKRG